VNTTYYDDMAQTKSAVKSLLYFPQTGK